jgi:hypothetical protein
MAAAAAATALRADSSGRPSSRRQISITGGDSASLSSKRGSSARTGSTNSRTAP